MVAGWVMAATATEGTAKVAAMEAPAMEAAGREAKATGAVVEKPAAAALWAAHDNQAGADAGTADDTAPRRHTVTNLHEGRCLNAFAGQISTCELLPNTSCLRECKTEMNRRTATAASAFPRLLMA